MNYFRTFDRTCLYHNASWKDDPQLEIVENKQPTLCKRSYLSHPSQSTLDLFHYRWYLNIFLFFFILFSLRTLCLSTTSVLDAGKILLRCWSQLWRCVRWYIGGSWGPMGSDNTTLHSSLPPSFGHNRIQTYL